MTTATYSIVATADDALSIAAFGDSDAGLAFGNLSNFYLMTGGLRFPGVELSATDVPSSAVVRLTAHNGGPTLGGVGAVGSNAGKLHGVTTPNLSALPVDLTTLPKTTAATTIVPASTVDIDVLAQVLEMLPARAAGDAMAFVGDPSTAATDSYLEAYDYSSSSTLCAQLIITWEAGGPPALKTLTLSPAATTTDATVGTTVGSIGGATVGSTLSLTDNAAGRFSLMGGAVKVASTLVAGTYNITVRETLDGATNTPRDTVLTITVAEAPIISFVGKVEGVTSATIPAHQVGDLILCWAYRDGSNTLPTLPSGQNWASLDGVTGANTNSARLVAKIATSTAEATGTFTSATSVIVQVYRAKLGYTLSWGAVAAATASSTAVSYAALAVAAGSWVAAFSGHRSINTALETPPAGMTLRSTVVDTTDEAAGFDTNGPVDAFDARTVPVGGTSAGWRSIVVEIKATPVGAPVARPTFQAFIIG